MVNVVVMLATAVLLIGGDTGIGVMIFCSGFSVMVSDSGLCGGNRPTVGNGCGLNNCKQITV
jgi:hypothetical protein